VSRKEIRKGVFQAMADQRFVAGRFLMLDFQDTKANFSSDNVRVLAPLLEGIRENFSPPLIAIVSDSSHYGFMRMLQLYAEPRGCEVRIFTKEQASTE
jgi:hypothetical protein